MTQDPERSLGLGRWVLGLRTEHRRQERGARGQEQALNWAMKEAQSDLGSGPGHGGSLAWPVALL